jgi:hypothetical protein
MMRDDERIETSGAGRHARQSDSISEELKSAAANSWRNSAPCSTATAAALRQTETSGKPSGAYFANCSSAFGENGR